MPDPPAASLLTRYLLENPYPLGGLLVAIGLVIAWLGLRDGRLDRVRLGLVPVAIGALVIGAGVAVVTAGERARIVVRDLVEAVVTNDLVGAVNQFSGDATLHLGSTRNPGLDLDGIRDRLSAFAMRYAVEENRITRLRAYTRGRDGATVHLACRTDAGGPYGATPSQWVLDVRRQTDGTWKVRRMTLVTVAGRAPPSW